MSYIDFEHPYGNHIRPYFLSRYLSEFGCNVSAICIRKGEKFDRLQFYERKWLNARPPFKYEYGLLDFDHLVRHLRPDVIYVHDTSFASLTLLLRKLSKLRLFKNRPIVADFHGSARLEASYNLPHSMRRHLLVTASTMIEKVAASNANLVITASDVLRSFVIYSYKVPPNKVFTVPNGVSTEHFFPLTKTRNEELRNNLGLSDRSVIVLTAPRMSAKPSDWSVKAIRIMYEVMSHLSSLKKDAILLIVGGGPRVSGSPPNVLYTGFVKNLNALLNIADLAVAPYPEELVCGGPRNKVLEYFACKVPVVSTKSGMYGIPEAKPYKYYVPTTFDHREIAERILATLSMDDESQQNMVNNAFHLIMTRYNWKKSAQLLQRKLVSMLEGGHSDY